MRFRLPNDATTPHRAQLEQTADGILYLMAVMSYRFGAREGSRGNSRHRIWHFGCAGAMATAVACLVAAEWAGIQTFAGLSVLLVVEVVCTLAFGASWLIKGAEISQTLVRMASTAKARKPSSRRRLGDQLAPPSPPTCERRRRTGLS
jgi:NhaP-type Na+/H+ or K+/H+ antiporter